jgi:hypothetical protein
MVGRTAKTGFTGRKNYFPGFSASYSPSNGVMVVVDWDRHSGVREPDDLVHHRADHLLFSVQECYPAAKMMVEIAKTHDEKVGATESILSRLRYPCLPFPRPLHQEVVQEDILSGIISCNHIPFIRFRS